RWSTAARSSGSAARRAWGWAMSSSRRWAARPAAMMAVAAAAGLGAACGSVHDASVGSAPVVVLHGHVDLSALIRGRTDAPLIGALVWAAVPQVSTLCLQYDLPEIQPGCPDPYGFFAGEIEAAGPVDGDGNFTIELYHLPKA